ncbi:unnamed protein product [Vitrella brassicaformis CCMP3155]|uniref:beta-glucosidase n=1 Tax=Vitrella brassicaformis (strain CCMP3155) TaxID=1169540 RepID=A0A0G4GWJ1_VITBC|nr:unnamed protein product [Vitrella brassicaformis CCMP3155]|eukprot:CEM35346.1 unnamed protein product [Vitrella brassicaformis CCMP3155]
MTTSLPAVSFPLLSSLLLANPFFGVADATAADLVTKHAGDAVARGRANSLVRALQSDDSRVSRKPSNVSHCAGSKRMEESTAGQMAAAIRKMFRGGELHANEFMWGAAVAAYQVEGSWNEGGRTASIWDVFTHQSKAMGLGKVANDDTGDEAAHFYRKYKEDIETMRELNLTHFRFSISWTRVLKQGMYRNEAGITFYKNLVRALKRANVEPVVTLYHWDMPDHLDWREDGIVEAFVTFAKLMFTELPTVKYWITLNEPWVFCKLGYQWGSHHLKCGHNALKAHARAYRLFKKDFAPKRPGAQVGLTLNADWRVPLDPSNPEDERQCEIEMDSALGWFAEPVYGSGFYPASLRKEYPHVLPNMTAADRNLIRNSSDFFGLNHYTTMYVDSTSPRAETRHRNGVVIGPHAATWWLYAVPWGFRRLLAYIQDKWNPPFIIVTENGMSDEKKSDVEDYLSDQMRIFYFETYLAELSKAILEDNVRVSGYFAWSLLDNLSWVDGYDKRYGFVYVDYGDAERNRTIKASGRYYSSLIRSVTYQANKCYD